MVEIPDTLQAVFSATIHDRDGEYIITLPESEFEYETLAAGETYRFALFEAPAITDAAPEEEDSPATERADTSDPPEPPVEEGEVRDVTIEAVGEQGDGIAKDDRGYVIIVPDGQPGEQPTVKIDSVQENVAFATIQRPDSRSL